MHRRPPSWCNWASEPKWKTERVVKHKFDDIDVDKFRNESIIGRLLYIGIFALTFKSILVYMADMVIMILSFVQIFDLNSCSNLPTNLKSQSSTESPTKDPRPIEITTAPLHLLCAGTDAFSAEFIPPDARPWILLTSILISLIFLFLDWRMAAVVIRSKDIAYAITTTIPYRYYVLKDFTTFCFFREISAPESLVERVAKFVLFGFKGWKRMLIAECPRQTLNMLTIVDILLAPKHQQRKANQFKSYVAYHEQNLVNLYAGAVARLAKGADHNPIPLVTFFLQSFTVTVWMLGISVIILATLAYIPLVCRIRGNLKEYICHKIDTRLAATLRERNPLRRTTTELLRLPTMERNLTLNHAPTYHLPVKALTPAHKLSFPLQRDSPSSTLYATYPRRKQVVLTPVGRTDPEWIPLVPANDSFHAVQGFGDLIVVPINSR